MLDSDKVNKHTKERYRQSYTGDYANHVGCIWTAGDRDHKGPQTFACCHKIRSDNSGHKGCGYQGNPVTLAGLREVSAGRPQSDGSQGLV